MPRHDPVNIRITNRHSCNSKFIFFSYFPKQTERDSRIIRSQISVKWITLDSRWRDLCFGIGFKLIQAFWILRIFLIHGIMDKGGVLEKKEKCSDRLRPSSKPANIKNTIVIIDKPPSKYNCNMRRGKAGQRSRFLVAS